jgi:SAM-dependent MidA family methyltransferase
MNKGKETGLHTTGLTTQSRFLINLGFLEEAQKILGEDQSSPDVIKQRLAMKTLIIPDGGMGDVFKILVQHKGIDGPQLDGLRDLGTF